MAGNPMENTTLNIVDLDEYRQLRWPDLWAAFERARRKARADSTGAHDLEAAEALRDFRQAHSRSRQCQG